MTLEPPPSLSRLAEANPAQADDGLGRSADAQEILSRILATDGNRARSGAPRRISRRMVLVLAAVLLLAAGAAVAAVTDPFGFWRSSTPGTAMFAVNPNRHVRTPTAHAIGCPTTGPGAFRCGAGLRGRRYEYLDRIPNQGTAALSRAHLQQAIEHALSTGQISAAKAQQVESDLRQVPDSFLQKFAFAMRFETISAGVSGNGDTELVPPPGVPSLLVCEPAARELSCRDLNGDHDAAVGSAVYVGVPGRDWVRRRVTQESLAPGERLMNQVFGGPLTAAETRFLRDLVADAATTTSTSSSSSATPVQP
jgi:hypothetical protein